MRKPGIMRCMVVCVAVLAVLGVVAASALAAEPPVLRVGSDIAFPPFEWQDEQTGEYKGFDMDLIRAIGKEMGMKVQIINNAWDGIIPGLLNGNYDVIISAMTITEERAQSVAFSDPYFTAGQVIVVRRGTEGIKGPADLKGKKVSVQINTTGDYAASEIPGIREIKRFNLAPDAFLELKNGGVDACIMDIAVAADAVKQDKSLQIVGAPFTAEYYGMALRKKDVDLLNKINKALATLKSTGEYDKIYNKYFGE